MGFKEKPIVHMSNWVVEWSDGEYNLCGRADNHPKLGKNVYIAITSKMQSSMLTDEESFVYETRNTIYICPLKFMKVNNTFDCYADGYVDRLINGCQEDTDINKVIKLQVAIYNGDMSDEYTIRVLELTKAGKIELIENKQREERRLVDCIIDSENTIYWEVSTISSGDTIAFNIDGVIGVLEAYIHTGMVQDSILYSDINTGIDFRYFPKGDSITTYAWSDNIDEVHIKNCKHYNIYFNKQCIKPEETKIFKREDMAIIATLQAFNDED